MTHPTDQKTNNEAEAFGRLFCIMGELRENCPWDQKQTMESLRHLTMEETFELSEAILEGNMEEIKKELGDVLLHIVFYARIAAEQHAFTMEEVINSLCEKLIYRHPHIYAKEKVDGVNAVRRNWEQLKLKEKPNCSVLGGVPHSLPSLIKAMRVQEKVSRIGLDWLDGAVVWNEVDKKVRTLRKEMNQEDLTSTQKEEAQKEFGDLLFSLVNYAMHMDINPEEALERANKEFVRKFQALEQEIAQKGEQLTQLSSKELGKYWKANT